MKFSYADRSAHKTIVFKCPGCKASHWIPVEGPNKWDFNFDMEKPTLSPSILVREYAGDNVKEICHSFVTDGRIRFLNDCTHKLAGQTVDLEELKKEAPNGSLRNQET